MSRIEWTEETWNPVTGCPVPEGAKVIEGMFRIGFVDANGALFTYQSDGWKLSGSFWFSSQRLDLSYLPVTDEVVGLLPEPLQKKWRELE